MHRRTSVSTAPIFRKRPRAVAATGLLSVLLAGCGLGLGDIGLKAPTAAELALGCPKVSIVRDLQEVTHLSAGGGRDATAVASRAALADFTGNCEYGSDGVTVNVKLAMVAERGPALQGDTDRYRYFVAVFRPGEQVPAAKSEFETGARFTAEDPRRVWVEEVTPHIPLPKDVNAKEWQVMVGFQLSAEELAYNRRQLQQGVRR
jgi:hypothetical protein